MKCDICNIHKAEYKDYRFIDSCGLQGKTLSCEYCRGLSDSTICEVVRDGLNPKSFFGEVEKNE